MDRMFYAFGDELRKLSKVDFGKLRKRHPGKVVVDPRDPGLKDVGAAYYNTASGKIVLRGEDTHALAHEMGHAQMQRTPLGKVIQHPLARGAMNFTLPAAAIAHGARLPAAAAMMAPTLGSELAASYRGKKLLEEEGVTPEEMDDYKRVMARGLASYAVLGPVNPIIQMVKRLQGRS